MAVDSAVPSKEDVKPGLAGQMLELARVCLHWNTSADASALLCKWGGEHEVKDLTRLRFLRATAPGRRQA